MRTKQADEEQNHETQFGKRTTHTLHPHTPPHTLTTMPAIIHMASSTWVAILLSGSSLGFCFVCSSDSQDTCDILDVALVKKPLASRGPLADAVLLTYLAIFGAPDSRCNLFFV